MSVLGWIRNNIGLIVIIIFLALVSFILQDVLKGIDSIFGGAPSAGVVAGKTITTVEYNERSNNALSQSDSGDELQNARIKDQVWEQLVSEVVLDQEFENVGLGISGDEIYDMFAGKEISPLLRNYFFRPEEPYDQNRMKILLQQLTESESPEQVEQLRLLEEYAARARAEQRYQNMIAAAFTASKALAKQKYVEQNRKVNLTYVGVNYAQIPDSLVKVSDSELKSYLSRYKKRYEQKDEETFIRYARFDLRPSKADSIKALNEVARLKTAFGEATDDSSFTQNKSRKIYSQAYVAPNALAESIRDSVVRASAKQVLGPIFEGGFYKLIKVVGTKAAEKPAAKVAHILIPYGADSAAAQTKAASLAAQARGGANFAQLATDNSDDYVSKAKGGDLGWYNPGFFGDEFDKAVNAAGTGSIVGPIKGRGGYHVVKVLDKSSLLYDVAEVETEVSYSSTTRDSVYGQANLFASKLMQSKDINKAASEAGIAAFESNAIINTTIDVLGLNGGREIAVWAANSDMNAISKVIRIKDTYVVAQVTKRNPAGIRPLDDLREEIELKVRNEKKAKMILEKLDAVAGSDLNAVKEAYGAGAFTNSATNITFETSTIPGIGADRLIVGKVAGMAQGETSKPIEGQNGVYIIQVTAVTEAPEADETTLASLKQSQMMQGKSAIQGKIMAALTELADVKDKRAETEARGLGY
ncbi:MAG: hypothetical protein EAZ89_19765 [Bacteroidetes bacterium]|nr:MAG: hypothetical protein EAZ89_19765 [Bacteroidota bacterium]